MSDDTPPRYDVTYRIEVWGHGTLTSDGKGGHYSNWGLHTFTDDCPPTMHNANKRQTRHAEERNYRVLSCTTSPLVPAETPNGMAYMTPALARRRHTTEGTDDDERVYYSVPVECTGWLERFLERQGYAAIPDDGDLRVVTTDEATAYAVAELEAERAAMAEREES